MNSGEIDLRLQRLSARLGWVPYFVLFIALAATALGAWYVGVTGSEKDEARFENEVHNTLDKISNRVTTYENLLRGTAGLVAAQPNLSEDEFRLYVDKLDLARLYPGIQGIGYSVRVHKDEVDELEESMAKSHPGFHTWPPVDGPYVHAIKYLEPLDRRNREALGYNMFSQSTRRMAMERARDTGELTSSGIVKLVQEIDEDIQAGFLIYLPLYETSEIPDSIEERRAELSGFIYAPFRADDLLEKVFDPVQPAVGFRVFDGSQVDPDRLVHTSPDWARATSQRGGEFRTVTHLRIAGRIWTLEISSLPGFGTADPQINARWIAVIGFLMSVILFAITRSQTRARAAAERALTNLHKSERELRYSETRVRRLVEANIIGIILGRNDGTITETNEAFLSMLGRSGVSIDHETLEELSASPSKDLTQYALTEVERKGQFGPYEHTFRRKDGSELPALIGMASVEGPSHDWVGFVLDLSERKHMETQLIEQKETLETLNRVQQVVSAELEVSKVLAAVSNAAAVLTDADESCFFYRDPESGSDFRYLNSENPDARRSAFVTRDHPAVQRAFADITPDGEPPLDSTREGVLAAPVVSRFGTVVGALVVTRSSEERFEERDLQAVSGLAAQAAVAIDNAQLYEEARRDRNMAEQANLAKDQFLANLSHELRTPMTAIIGWVRMLQLGDLDAEEYAEAIDAISRSAQAQAQLVEDILDVSRIATGKMKIAKQSINLVEVIEAAVDSVWPSIESKGIDFRSKLPDEPVRVSGDPHRLQQVVWNLLSNAVKFTGRGGMVEIAAEQFESTARITIRDDGEGIDPGALPHIFERFRQADGTTTRTYGGLGLGLSLVDYIVRAHGGSASAQSEGKGEGSCFTVDLPLEILFDPERPPERAIPDSGTGLDNRKILLAEDDPEIRHLIHTILQRAGARVTSVRDASQALDHLLNESFDLLISDIAMPGEDGVALIHKVRQTIPGNQSIPAIALTAFASADDRNRILEAGYDDHLMKPLEPEILIQKIRDLILRD